MSSKAPRKTIDYWRFRLKYSFHTPEIGLLMKVYDLLIYTHWKNLEYWQVTKGFCLIVLFFCYFLREVSIHFSFWLWNMPNLKWDKTQAFWDNTDYILITIHTQAHIKLCLHGLHLLGKSDFCYIYDSTLHNQTEKILKRLFRLPIFLNIKWVAPFLKDACLSRNGKWRQWSFFPDWKHFYYLIWILHAGNLSHCFLSYPSGTEKQILLFFSVTAFHVFKTGCLLCCIGCKYHKFVQPVLLQQAFLSFFKK